MAEKAEHRMAARSRLLPEEAKRLDKIEALRDELEALSMGAGAMGMRELSERVEPIGRKLEELRK